MYQECPEEEQKAWDEVDKAICEEREPPGYEEDPNENLRAEEPEPEGWVEGCYWLPIYFGIFVGALANAANAAVGAFQKGKKGASSFWRKVA